MTAFQIFCIIGLLCGAFLLAWRCWAEITSDGETADAAIGDDRTPITATGILSARIAQLVLSNICKVTRERNTNRSEFGVSPEVYIAYRFQHDNIDLSSLSYFPRQPTGAIRLLVDDKLVSLRPADTKLLYDALVNAWQMAEAKKAIEQRKEDDLEALEMLGRIK